MGGSGTSTLDSGTIPLHFEDYGTDSYRVTPEHPLQPGEYAIGLRAAFLISTALEWAAERK